MRGRVMTWVLSASGVFGFEVVREQQTAPALGILRRAEDRGSVFPSSSLWSGDTCKRGKPLLKQDVYGVRD